MRLRQLYEAKGKVASFALGRLNPATSGHELLVDAIKNAPGDSFLFLTDRASKLPTDPLSPQEKLDWARKSFDGINIGLAKTVLTAADRLYKMGYTEVTFLEGEPKLLKILQQYNGVEKEMHNYNFTKINYVQLKRDPEAGDATGMSASKLRQTVLDNNIDSFKRGVTKQALPYADEMFKKLQGIMGVDAVEQEATEDYEVKQQKPKLDVLNNISMRKDNTPFPLSWNSGKDEISVGGKLFISPSDARKFINFYDRRSDDEQQLMQKALRSAKTAANLFKNLNLHFNLQMDR
tara:strand:+ start:1009 stop:1884 length:876 start_codon:yes stop_codon:yes gene_type:complete